LFDCLDATCVQPSSKILALTDIEEFQVSASLDDGLDTGPGDPDTAAHRQVAEFEEV
jgi:hypothetical protein